MTIVKWLFKCTVLFSFSTSFLAYAVNPCAGKGTIVFFVNGLFDDRNMARSNLDKFQAATQSSLSDIQNLAYQLAWVEDSSKFLQLAQAVSQRGMDDFQRYWLWLYGLEKAPSWFDEQVRDLVTDPKILNGTVLPWLNNHLELYSDAVLQGYDVIVVSNSAGNFYANAALRALPDYVPAALQPSINERHQANPDYPKTEDVIANIQIAAPVRETVNNSLWVNFKDDQVLNWIRPVANVLPGNINSSGASASDLRAHDLESYLRVDESRNQIIKYMHDAYSRLKYPIPYFEKAATVEYLDIVRNQVKPGGFDVSFFLGPKEMSKSYDEKATEKGGRFDEFMLDCRELHPGDVEVRGETIWDRPSEKDFSATGYVGVAGSPEATVLRMTNRREISRWTLGLIKASHGQGKDPFDVDIKYFNPPRSRP